MYLKYTSTDSSGVRGGEVLSKPGMPDNIYVLEPTRNIDKTWQSTVFPPGHKEIVHRERADYLPEFTRAVEGTVTLDRRGHTASARIFGGSKATRTHTRTVLLDTGSPSTFIQHKVWLRMLGCGAASNNGLKEAPERKWGGFHGIPLMTSSRVRLNIQMGGEGGIPSGGSRAPAVGLAVHAHMVPDDALTHAVLLGRDSWADFPTRTFEDVSNTKTAVTFSVREGGAADSFKNIQIR